MKILFLSAASSVHTVRWVNVLAERGYEIVLVSQADHKAKGDSISEKVKILYLPFCGTKGYYLNAPFLHQIYKKENCDAVNVHYASGYGTLARMAKLPKVILNVWGSDVYDFPVQGWIKEQILRKNLAYAEKLASTSYSMARQTEKYLTEKREIAITPFGVDTKHFKADSDLKYKKYQTEKRDTFVFGIVKTLSPKYGVATVIRAFSEFLQKLPEQERGRNRLEIYGKGELFEKLKQLVLELHLERQVFFGGYVENNKIPALLNGMDIFMLGSESESFGVAAVEAMSCELPVVATKVSGFREVIEDGKTGFLVPVGDYEEMAEKMLILYNDPELRKQMGMAGRERVVKLYDWEKNVDEMERVYKEL